MLVIALNSATCLFWAFRYMWFSVATVPIERFEVAVAVLCSSFFVLTVTGMIRAEMNPNKRGY